MSRGAYQSASDETMRRGPKVAALITAVVVAAGCDSITTPDIDEVGTVRLVEVEGGCWVIETETEVLEPISLPEGIKTDGLVVTFEANRRPDLASVCQLGSVVEILRIRQLDD